MSFDVEGALKAGYSQEDINEYLASKTDFDLTGAIGAGYNSQEVLKYLTDKLSTDSPLRDLIPSVTAPTPRAPRAPAVDVGPTDAEIAAVRERINTNADSGFLRQTLDLPVQLGKGIATGTRFITDVFGADNPVSQQISGVEDFLDGLLSAQAKQDQQEVSRIMQEAEDKGLKDQVIAGLQAFAVAPLDLITNAFGTSAPTLIAGLLAPAGMGAAVATGVGTLTGVGITKDAAYNAVYEELLTAGVDEANAKEAATEAQAYSGENLDNIAFGGFLGALAAKFGLEGAVFGRNVTSKIAAPSMAASIGSTAVKEAIPEAMQGGQEQLTRNVALQREGFDVPTGRGIAGAATLEGTVGLPVGALAGYGTGKTKKAEAKALDTLAARFTGEDTVTPAPVDQEEAIELIGQAGLDPEEQNSLNKWVELDNKTQAEELNFNKVVTEEEIADLKANNVLEKDLSERITVVNNARQTMNRLAAREAEALGNLEAAQIAFDKGEIIENDLDNAKADLEVAQQQLFKLNQAGLISGRATSDPSTRQAKKADKEQVTQAYDEEARTVPSFNAKELAIVNAIKAKPLPQKTETITPEGAFGFYLRDADVTENPEMALIEIAEDVATDPDATLEEMQTREVIPEKEILETAIKNLETGVRRGRDKRTKLNTQTVKDAATWVRESNLSPQQKQFFENRITQRKADYQQQILNRAVEIRRENRQPTQKRPVTKNPIRQGEATGEVTSAIVPPVDIGQTTDQRAEAEALQQMGLKQQPRSEARKKEFNQLKREAKAKIDEEFAKAQQDITSEDIAAQVERQGITFPQNIPNEVREVAERGNLKQVIDQLLNDEPKEIQFLLRKLRRMAANTKIRIAPVPIDAPIPGMFNEATNEIVLDPDRGLNKKVLFHELGHAALSRRLDNPNSKEAEVFFEFFSEIKDQMGDAYGGTDLHEFVSEFLGNETFRALLKDIKAPNSENLFTRIINAILRLLGINKDKQTPTAYDKAFEFIEQIANLGTESEAPPIERIFFANENPDKVIPDVFEDTIPPFNKTKIASTLDKVKENRRLFRAGLKFLRLDNFEELYGKYLPSIKK